MRYEVKSTRDYKIFRTIKGNRAIVHANINRITKSIMGMNLLNIFPVVVNERMEVIDGQHRLQVAKQLELEVFYKVVPGLTIKDVIAINSAQKEWKLSDYLECYCKLEDSNYTRLKEFVEHTKLTITTAFHVLGQSKNHGVKELSDFKAGKYELSFHELNKAYEVWEYLKTYHVYFETLSVKLIQSVMDLLLHPDYDHDRMERKLAMQKNIETRSTRLDNLRYLEDIYNHRENRNNRLRFEYK